MLKKKKKSKTVQIKGICPHCNESLIINLVKPDDYENNLNDIEFIDIKNSKEFANTLKSNSNPGVSKDMMPDNGECPKCQRIIFFNDIPNITIIDFTN